MSVINTELWNLVIECNQKINNLWSFNCKDLKTNKEYEKLYLLAEIIDKHKILNMYPSLFETLIKKQEPKVRFENYAIISWEIDVPFIGKEIIQLNIEEKNALSMNLANNTLLEIKLKELNEVLKNRIVLLEEKIKDGNKCTGDGMCLLRKYSDGFFCTCNYNCQPIKCKHVTCNNSEPLCIMNKQMYPDVCRMCDAFMYYDNYYIYLNIGSDNKHIAKQLGAKFNIVRGKWMIKANHINRDKLLEMFKDDGYDILYDEE